jgi:hypothetical protein
MTRVICIEDSQTGAAGMFQLLAAWNTPEVLVKKLIHIQSPSGDAVWAALRADGLGGGSKISHLPWGIFLFFQDFRTGWRGFAR